MNEPMNCELPRTVWMYWEQGVDKAPDVVRHCLDSWREKNPGWKVVMLDQESVAEFADLSVIIGPDHHRLPVQNRSDILRLNLLARHGGVWADATCLCHRSLDSWIHKCMRSGFFAFRDPGRDRLIASWFMAACTGNHLIRSFCAAHNAYWKLNRFPDQKTALRRFLVRKLRVLFGKRQKSQDLWLSFLVRRVFKVFPYFIIHYHFGRHVRRDPKSWAIFSAMPYLSAKSAGMLMRQMMGKAHPLGKRAQSDDDFPVSKLSWKKTYKSART